MPDRPALAFWFDFASTYSYLSAMRIEEEAGKAGLGVLWRPFLLGPIFAAQGWSSSPFNLYPAKGRHMWRDMEREAAGLGLPLARPEPFPQNSLLPARLATVGLDRDWGAPFCRAVFRAEFGEGRSVGEAAVLRDLLAGLGLDPDAALAEAGQEGTKRRLRERTEEAAERGLFGAPTFVTPDGELFWGNDRLERAIAWASGSGRRT